MGIAADSLFSVLMSWVRALVSALWALFSGDGTTALEFLGKNWMAIAAVMIVGGLVIDWIVWLIRWQPYHLWARRLREMLRLDEPDEEETPKKGRAHAAVLPEKRYARPQEPMRQEEAYLYDDTEEDEEDFLDEEETLLEEARARAETERADRERMEQEARAYQAERARLAREAYEAEQARLAQEAYEAEQARLAQEAYEAEQARLAQEEYERQLAEYERQKAQYERDLAEYERQKAEYEAQLAAQEQAESACVSRRRRTNVSSEAEALEETRVQAAVRPKKQPVRHDVPANRKSASATENKPVKKQTENRMEQKAEVKANKSSGLLGRMAKMIEPEEEELITRKTLPPRVDMHDAFRTAKLPVITLPKDSRRRKG